MPSKKLPFELLYRIFDDLESIKDLINCRLVCKKWDPVAEMVIFGKRIYIKSEDAAIKFFYYLLRKLSNGGLVKYLSVYIRACGKPFNNACFAQLLPLVFTPRLEDLDADCIDEATLQTMMEIAQKIPTKVHLKRIPSVRSQRLYKQAALFFKDTLEQVDFITLDDTEFLCLLGQFKNLKTVKLNYDSPTINLDGLKLLVDNCPVLECLKIIGDLSNDDMTKGDIVYWFNQNDSQLNQTLKMLIVSGNCWTPCLIEYFNLKYAKIEITELDLGSSGGFDADEVPSHLRDSDGMFYAGHPSAEQDFHI